MGHNARKPVSSAVETSKKRKILHVESLDTKLS